MRYVQQIVFMQQQFILTRETYRNQLEMEEPKKRNSMLKLRVTVKKFNHDTKTMFERRSEIIENKYASCISKSRIARPTSFNTL